MSKYPMVGCSQCGTRFAGGNEGYSLCRNHQHRRGLTDREIDAMTAHAAAIKAENHAYTEGQLRAGLPTVDGVAFRDRVHTTDGVLIAMVLTATSHADAQRLAACWNACAGIPTAALELCGTCIDTPEQGEHL